MSAFVRPAVKRLLYKLYSPKYLIVTNTVSCGVVMAIGDVATQRIERIADDTNHTKKLDWYRTGRLFVIGVCMGPLNHGWYIFLDKVLPTAKPIVVVKKILMDQIVAAPCMTFGFFMGASLLEKQPIEASWTEFKSKFWTVYKADWLIWPAAQAINFFFFPPQYRVLYVLGVTFFWDAFLSYMKHRKIDGHVTR